MTDAPLGDDPALRIEQDVEEVLERFDAAWQDGRRPQIQHYLPTEDDAEFDAAQRRQILEELIKIDLEYRWRRRRRRKATERHLSTLHEKTKAAKRRSLPFRPHWRTTCGCFPNWAAWRICRWT